MADRQTPEDKAEAMKEYRSDQQAAIDRIAGLRAARLAREADAQIDADAEEIVTAPAKKKKAR